ASPVPALHPVLTSLPPVARITQKGSWELGVGARGWGLGRVTLIGRIRQIGPIGPIVSHPIPNPSPLKPRRPVARTGNQRRTDGRQAAIRCGGDPALPAG